MKPKVNADQRTGDDRRATPRGGRRADDRRAEAREARELREQLVDRYLRKQGAK